MTKRNFKNSVIAVAFLAVAAAFASCEPETYSLTTVVNPEGA